MPWTRDDYPKEMEHLDLEVRAKAIEIANALMEDGNMEEDQAIGKAIGRAETMVRPR